MQNNPPLNCIIFIDDLSGLMRKKTPKPILKLLRIAGTVANELGYDIYVVGGFVRDLLLDRPTFDIDMVVDGDGIKTARRLAQLVNSNLKIFDRFETACFNFGKKIHVDIATARSERYTGPASLPLVERSSLKCDLGRRDFTINTLAICINSNRFGFLADCYNGRSDLKNRTIKVLHDRSFIDDPTRIIRAVRLEQRYGFSIDPNTLALAADAIKKGTVNKLSRDRILNELYYILKEDRPWRVIERLSEIGLMESIFSGFVYDERTGYYMQKAARFIKKLEKLEPVNKIQVMLLCTFAGYGNRLSQFPALLKLSREKLRDFENLTRKNRILKLLNNNIDPISLYDILKELSPEFIVFLYAICRKHRVQKNLAAYMRLLKKKRISINGKDLICLGIKPGPHYKTIFNQIIHMRLNGIVKSKAGELRAARLIYSRLQEDS